MRNSITIVEYDVKQRAETIVADKTFNDTRYGSINIGTVDVTVDGVTLAPGEGIEHVLQPTQTWKEPIVITVQAGGAVRLLREINTPKAKTYFER